MGSSFLTLITAYSIRSPDCGLLPGSLCAIFSAKNTCAILVQSLYDSFNLIVLDWIKYLISYFPANRSSKDFIKNCFAPSESLLFISILIIPPQISLTIGALSLLFKTIPIKSCLYLSGDISYLLPTYFFLDTIKNGQNVFS